MMFLYSLSIFSNGVTLSLDLSLKMVVREAMSSPVISVNENEDIVQVANKMREQKVGAVIVLNSNGKPVGIQDRKKFYSEIKEEFNKKGKITRKVKAIRLILMN